MTNAIDTLALLRTFLLADGTLATAVSNRIWVGEVPDDELGSMPRDSVLIVTDSSQTSVSVPVIWDRPQIICYGGTDRAAYQVYLKVYNAMQRKGLQSVSSTARLMQAYKSGGPISFPEQELGWARVSAFFTCIWAENVMV